MIKFILPLLFCLSVNAQIVIRGATLRGATVGTTNAGSGGGGGCTPAYVTGDRTASITVTSSVGLFNDPAGPENLVKGDLTGHYWFNGITLDGSQFVTFYFNGTPTLITEWKWYQDNATGQGTWQWSGSDDDVSYINIGGTFTLGGATTLTITTLSGNTTKYKYYKVSGISGSTSSSPFQLNVEAKSCQ